MWKSGLRLAQLQLAKAQGAPRQFGLADWSIRQSVWKRAGRMGRTISVIIEWENAKLSELARAERMLARLGEQMAVAARRHDLQAELIVLYDSDEIDESVPRTAVEARIPANAWPGVIRIEKAPGQHYYEQKNTGAKLATGEFLVAGSKVC